MAITFLTDGDKVVRYDAQALTEEQKAQARANIGVNGQGANVDLSGYATVEYVDNAVAGVGTPTDTQVATAVGNYLTEHPEAVGTVADGSITTAKVDNTIKQVLGQAGLTLPAELNWEIGYLQNNGKYQTNSYCASATFYATAGDSMNVNVTDGSLRYRYAYMGEDGNTYEKDKSDDSSWLTTSKTFECAGYHRISITFVPTSTTAITEENMTTLLEKFTIIRAERVEPINGENLKDNSVSAIKLADDVNKAGISFDNPMSQACVGAISFGHAVGTGSSGLFYGKQGNLISLGAGFAMVNNTAPDSTAICPSGAAVGSISDICVVGDETWVFISGTDDKAGYGVIYRFAYDPYTNNLRSFGWVWHNFGHVNAANYNPVTDTIIMGNGSADYDLTNKIYLMHSVSAIKELPNASIVDFADYGIEIDATGYDFGKKLNVVWANLRTHQFNYGLTEEYLPNVAIAYADDCNRMSLIAIGYDANQYAYGTYSEPAHRWNGTFNVLASYQTGDPDEPIENSTNGSYRHCGQGGDFFAGELYVGLGHTAITWEKVRFTGEGEDAFEIETVWQPSFNPATGVKANAKTNGIAVTKDFLIVGVSNTVYYLPR